MTYLIEFRFQGRTKKKIKSMIWGINKKFHIGQGHRPVPHITLVGPLTTKNERKLISDFNSVCSKYPLMKLKVNGFNTFENNRVVYIDINPSQKLDEFRWELAQAIRPNCKVQSQDQKRKFYFHATLAKSLSSNKFRKVKAYINSGNKPKYSHFVLRATLLKRGKILKEYDFLLRRLLTRREAKSKTIYRRTIALLQKFFESKHDVNKNVQREVKKSLWEKIKSFLSI